MSSRNKGPATPSEQGLRRRIWVSYPGPLVEEGGWAGPGQGGRNQVLRSSPEPQFRQLPPAEGNVWWERAVRCGRGWIAAREKLEVRGQECHQIMGLDHGSCSREAPQNSDTTASVLRRKPCQHMLGTQGWHREAGGLDEEAVPCGSRRALGRFCVAPRSCSPALEDTGH